MEERLLSQADTPTQGHTSSVGSCQQTAVAKQADRISAAEMVIFI